MRHVQKEDFSGGIYDCISNRLFFISPVPALWGKPCSVTFILVWCSLEFNGVETGRRKEGSAVLHSYITSCGTAVTKDVIQLPVRKSEGPFIYWRISRTYTGWQMRLQQTWVLLQRPLDPAVSEMALDIWAAGEKSFGRSSCGILGTCGQGILF